MDKNTNALAALAASLVAGGAQASDVPSRDDVPAQTTTDVSQNLPAQPATTEETVAESRFDADTQSVVVTAEELAAQKAAKLAQLAREQEEARLLAEKLSKDSWVDKVPDKMKNNTPYDTPGQAALTFGMVTVGAAAGYAAGRSRAGKMAEEKVGEYAGKAKKGLMRMKHTLEKNRHLRKEAGNNRGVVPDADPETEDKVRGLQGSQTAGRGL